MPTSASWFVENRIIFAKNTGVLSESETFEFDRKIVEMFNQSSVGLIHLVLDASELQGLPSIKVMRKFESLKHPKMGWMLPFGAKINPIVNMLGTITLQLFKVRMRQFKTLEEALTFLQYVDTTLPDLKVLSQ